MVTDQQVRKLQKLLLQGLTLQAAAFKSSMSEPTARRYRRMGKLPSEVEPDHHWRTRKNPLDEVWPIILETLKRIQASNQQLSLAGLNERIWPSTTIVIFELYSVA